MKIKETGEEKILQGEIQHQATQTSSILVKKRIEN
jgi:hypothetical protein